MNITRRSFVKTFGVAVLTAGFANPAQSVFGQVRSMKDELFLIPPESTNDPLTYLTSQHFKPFVNTFARVWRDDKRFVQLELIEVSELRQPSNEKRGFGGESYSLLFRSADKVKLPQDTYKIEHDTLGELRLFLVSVGLRGNLYEAVVNRISR